MSWAKFDDKLHEDAKLEGVSDAAFRLWVLAITWSNDKLTDGHVPTGRPMKLVTMRNPKKVVQELVGARLWHMAAHPCKQCLEKRTAKRVREQIPSSGYLIHDYHEYQPAAWAVKRDREQRSEAGRRGGLARGERIRSEMLSEPLQEELPGSNGQRSEPLSEMPSEMLSEPLSDGGKHLAKRTAKPRTPYSRTPVPRSDSEGRGAQDEPDIPDEPGAVSQQGSRGLRHVGEVLSRVQGRRGSS